MSRRRARRVVIVATLIGGVMTLRAVLFRRNEHAEERQQQLSAVQ